MISMPLSSGSFSSSSVRPARPPPNSVLKVSWKLWLIAANASAKRWRVVSSIRLIASLVCAIESTRSLRCVVRNAWRVSSSSNCSIAIMLTGPRRSILRAQRGDRFFGAQRALLGGRRPPRRPSPVGRPARRASSLVGLLGADDARRRASTLPSRSSSLDLDDDLVERGLTASTQVCARCDEVAFGGGAGDVELGRRRRESIRARRARP